MKKIMMALTLCLISVTVFCQEELDAEVKRIDAVFNAYGCKVENGTISMQKIVEIPGMTSQQLYNTVTDTIVVTAYDTIYETVYDTIYVLETFNELRLYPVPTRDYVNVEYNGYLDYKIYDNIGKLLETGSVVSFDKLDLTGYAAGTYYFNAKLDNGTTVTKKMIKITL